MRALLDEHRSEVADIVTLAQADLVEAWPGLASSDVAEAKRLLKEALGDLVATYAPLSAETGAQFYTELRAEAGVTSRFTARLAVDVSAEQLAAGAGWSVGPLLGSVPDDVTALSRAGGFLQRMVSNADRATIITNAERDPEQVRWYRGASAGACAFCAMAASREAVYRSESSAGFDSHNNCRCFPVALFPGQSVEVPGYYRAFDDEYRDAAAAAKAGNPDLKGDAYTRAVLSEWRKATTRS